MGFSKAMLHIKVENEQMREDIDQYFAEMPQTSGMFGDIPAELMDEIGMFMGDRFPDSEEKTEGIVIENGYAHIDKVGLENFGEIAKDISVRFSVPVLSAMVFDSDVVSVQVYQNGKVTLEELHAYEENRHMDYAAFIELFNFDCQPEAIESIFEPQDVVFAEDYLEKLGDIIGMKLI